MKMLPLAYSRASGAIFWVWRDAGISQMWNLELVPELSRQCIRIISHLEDCRPDGARLEHFICELDTGSEPLPPGTHDNKDVIRKWFEERVFIEDEHPRPIYKERANKFTTYRGSLTTFKTLREIILRDINDLVDFIFSPAGEETRENMRTRISHRPPLGTKSGVMIIDYLVRSLQSNNARRLIPQPPLRALLHNRRR